MRQIRILALACLAALASSLLAAPSGHAATANSFCSKSGQTTKIGGKNYVCAKNPTVKGKRLRWTLQDCLSANTAYLTSLKSKAEIEASNVKNLETIDASIKSLQIQVPIDKARAAAETENAVRNRSLAAEKAKEAETKLAEAKTSGIVDIPSSWSTQYQAVTRDKQITTNELASLGRTWNLNTDQTVLAIQYLSLQLQVNTYITAAERYEKNAATFLKSEQNLAFVTAQREATVKTQRDLVTLTQIDVTSKLSSRDKLCKVK